MSESAACMDEDADDVGASAMRKRSSHATTSPMEEVPEMTSSPRHQPAVPSIGSLFRQMGILAHHWTHLIVREAAAVGIIVCRMAVAVYLFLTTIWDTPKIMRLLEKISPTVAKEHEEHEEHEGRDGAEDHDMELGRQPSFLWKHRARIAFTILVVLIMCYYTVPAAMVWRERTLLSNNPRGFAKDVYVDSKARTIQNVVLATDVLNWNNPVDKLIVNWLIQTYPKKDLPDINPSDVREGYITAIVPSVHIASKTRPSPQVLEDDGGGGLQPPSSKTQGHNLIRETAANVSVQQLYEQMSAYLATTYEQHPCVCVQNFGIHAKVLMTIVPQTPDLPIDLVPLSEVPGSRKLAEYAVEHPEEDIPTSRIMEEKNRLSSLLLLYLINPLVVSKSDKVHYAEVDDIFKYSGWNKRVEFHPTVTLRHINMAGMEEIVTISNEASVCYHRCIAI